MQTKERWEIWEEKQAELFNSGSDKNGYQWSLPWWRTQYTNDFSNRNSCGWDDVAETMMKVHNRTDNLGINNRQLDGFNGTQLRDIQLNAAEEFALATLWGADVDFMLVPYSGRNSVDNNQIVLEQLLNESFDGHSSGNYATFSEALKGVITNSRYLGEGILKTWWNINRVIPPNWRTGTIAFESVNPFDVAVDSASVLPNHIDARWAWQKQSVSINFLEAKYPHMKGRFKETSSGGSYGSRTSSIGENAGMCDIVRCEYKYEWPIRQAIVYSNVHRGEVYYVEEEELKEFLKENKLADGMSITSFKDIIVEKVYSFSVIAETWEVIQEPKDTHSPFSYTWHCAKQRYDSTYSYGDAWLQLDSYISSTAIMTYLMMQLMKHNKPIPVLLEGFIKNLDEVRLTWGTPDCVIILDEEKISEQPDLATKAIQQIQIEVNAQLPLAFQQFLENRIKSYSGAVDAQRGINNPSVTSGIQNMTMLDAASTYWRPRIIDYQNFLARAGTKALKLIVFFLEGEEITIYVDGRDPIIIDWSMGNKLSDEPFRVVPNVNDHPEQKDEFDKNLAINVFDRGVISPIDLLDKIGYRDATLIYDRALEARNLKQIEEAMAASPEVANAIMAIIQQAQQENNTGNA